MPTEKEVNARLLPSCMMGILVTLTLALFFLGYSAADDDDGILKEHQAPIEESSTEYANDNDVDTSSSNVNHEKKRITVLGLHEILDLKRSDIFGLGNDHGKVPPRLNYNELHANDMIEDSLFDPISPGQYNIICMGWYILYGSILICFAVLPFYRSILYGRRKQRR